MTKTKNFLVLVKNHQGLTLIEVLIALILIGLLFLGIDFGLQTNRSQLEDAISQIERSVRFSSHEAVLRGAIMRIHFEMDKSPQEYAVEFGPNGDYVLPLFKDMGENNKLSLEDEEKRNKMISSMNKVFTKVPDLQDNNAKFSPVVRLVALASSLNKGIVLDGDSSLFTYPSGERDAALLIFATNQELGILEVEPFTDKLTRRYVPLTGKSEEELVNEQEKLIREEYEKWQRNR